MNADGSIVEFFYNIVPGSLFIILLKHYEIFDAFTFLSSSVSSKPIINSDSALTVFIDVALGLLLGFVFQGIIKFARDYFCLNSKIVERVKRDNEKEYILASNQIGLKKEEPTLKAFYLMDNFLRGDHRAFLANHFSSRFAFWSNIFIATGVILLLRILFKHVGLDNDNFFLLILLWFSYSMLDKHFYAYYDSILKSYFMLKNIKYKT